MSGLRDDLAAVQHEIWSHWMKYLRSQGKYVGDHFLLDGDDMEKWMKQTATPYSELSEKEQRSDREQADKVILVLARVEENFQHSKELLAVEQWITNPDVDRTHSVGELVNRTLTLFLAWARMMEIKLG